MKSEWVPLDRLGPIPEECLLNYEGKDPRKKLLREASKAGCVLEKVSDEIQIGQKPSPVVSCMLETIRDPNERTPPTSSNHYLEGNPSIMADRKLSHRYVAFISLDVTLLKIIDGDKFAAEVFADMSSFSLLFLNSTFSSAVEEVLIFLPPAEGSEYVSTLKKIINHAKQFEKTLFYFAPPPPVGSRVYDRAMDLFLELFYPHKYTHIVKMEHRLKSLYTLGWLAAGDNSTKFHVTKEGFWSRGGFEQVYAFLSDSMGITWPFKLCAKEKKLQIIDQQRIDQEAKRQMTKFQGVQKQKYIPFQSQARPRPPQNDRYFHNKPQHHVPHPGDRRGSYTTQRQEGERGRHVERVNPPPARQPHEGRDARKSHQGPRKSYSHSSNSDVDMASG
jgi:hypothetical protein